MEIMQQQHSSAEEIESWDDKKEKKWCSICKTTKTPLWRNGPNGPKSACNACGIKYRKEKPLKRRDYGRKKQKCASDVSKEEGKNGKAEEEKEVVVRRRKLGEVERAAAVLMAMSCGL